MKCEDRFCPCCYASEHIRDYMDAEHEKALRAERKARRKASTGVSHAPSTPRT